MKTALTILFLAASATAASAQYNSLYGSSGSSGYGTKSNPSSHYLAPHYNSHSGGIAQGYHATNPNSTVNDNYGTNPNVNPYTG
jgi:hypothetical protein